MGLFSWFFADIFYGSKELILNETASIGLRFILVSFLMLLVTNSDVFSLFFPIPSLDTYIQFLSVLPPNFWPFFWRILSMPQIWCSSLFRFCFILWMSLRRTTKWKRNWPWYPKLIRSWTLYGLIWEIAEDRERKRIAREIHDTLGHALTGISAGLDAVGVLIDIDPNRAKEQVKNVSEVVREGIQDVRGSLNRLRPGALEGRTLKYALERWFMSIRIFQIYRLI